MDLWLEYKFRNRIKVLKWVGLDWVNNDEGWIVCDEIYRN